MISPNNRKHALFPIAAFLAVVVSAVFALAAATVVYAIAKLAAAVLS